MNKDQVNGSIKSAAGQAQKAVGKAIDSDEQIVKGAGKEIEGKAQKALGDAKATLRDAAKRV